MKKFVSKKASALIAFPFQLTLYAMLWMMSHFILDTMFYQNLKRNSVDTMFLGSYTLHWV